MVSRLLVVFSMFLTLHCASKSDKNSGLGLDENNKLQKVGEQTEQQKDSKEEFIENLYKRVLQFIPKYANINLTNVSIPLGEMIDVGGYKVNILCMGKEKENGKTVIINTGSGATAITWVYFMEELSSFAHVCIWDRPGYGWSELGPNPRTLDRIVQELHTLLEKKGIHQELVVIGQSYGGLIAREFEKAYPKQVSAVVLVDPSAERPGEKVKSDQGFNKEKFNEYKKSIPPLSEVEKEFAKIESKNEPESEKKRKILNFLDQILLFREKSLDATFHEDEYFHRGVDQANHHPSETISRKPFIIISAEHGVLTKAHRELVKVSSKGELIHATGSGHDVHLDKPEFVINALKKLLNENSMSKLSTDQNKKNHLKYIYHLIEEWKKTLENDVKSGQVPGGIIAVVDINGIKPITKYFPYGKTNLSAHSSKISPDTVFEIASLTKMFVGLALGVLNEKGLVSLHDPLSKIFPDLKNYEAGKITLLHLATHTSGLPALTKKRTEVFERLNKISKENSLEEYKQLLDQLAMEDESEVMTELKEFTSRDLKIGESSHYSNFGLGLLGYSLMKVTGTHNLDELMSIVMTKDLGMHSTRTNFSADMRKVFADPHLVEILNNQIRKRKLYQTHKQPFSVSASAAGGLLSTARDLEKILIAELEPEQLQNKFLGQGILLQQAEYFQSFSNPELEQYEGLGITILKSKVQPENRYFGKGAGSMGSQGEIMWSKKFGIGFLILENSLFTEEQEKNRMDLMLGMIATPDKIPVEKIESGVCSPHNPSFHEQCFLSEETF